MPPTTLTPEELNAPAGMSTIDGGYMSGNNPLPAPVTQPSSPVVSNPTVSTPEPTMSEALSGIKSEALRIQDILNQRQAEEQAAAVGPFQSPTSNAYPTFEELYGEPIDAEEVNRSTLKMFQDQIDATNAVYDQLLADERLRGEGRLGSQRAITARGGLLGSDFAGAQKARVQDYNTGQQRLIGAERQAAIGAILGTARREAAQAIADKRAARQQGAENYLSYLANSQANRLNNVTNVVQAFIAQGIDPSELDETELQTIASEIGASPADIVTNYRSLTSAQEAAAASAELDARKTESEITKNLAQAEAEGFVTLGEGTMLYNPQTGEMVKNPKTYKPTGASGLSTASGTLNQEQVADVHELLSGQRGEDGYTNTGEYMNQLQGFVSLGGDPKDFVKEYDPDIYINPNDPTRSFLEAFMKKQSNDNFFVSAFGGVDIQSAINEAASGQ